MKEIVEILKAKKQTISTMESCTGGAIVNEITNIEGASNVIKYSAITYSNEFKIKMGISKEVIEEYTVYSQQVADEMSMVIANYTDSDYGIGVTGKLCVVDDKNPYGENDLVYISIYDRNKKKFYHKINKCHQNNRLDNKISVVNEVVKLLKEIL